MTTQKPHPGREFISLMLVAIASLLTGLYAWHHYSAANTELVTRPAFELPDSDGQLRHVSEWDGQVLLLNFWATWCPPCRAEIPMLSALQTELADQGFQIVGLAMDRPAAVSAFLDEVEMSYPTLVGDRAVTQVADACGDTIGALPFNVVVNRDGKIVERHFGELDRETALALIEPHLLP